MKLKEPFLDYLVPTLAIFIAGFIVSYVFGLWFGYPRGADALSHILKTEHILLTWPHHNWWSIWAGGMPLFLYYPPLPYYFMAVIKILTNIPVDLLLNLLGIISVCFTALAIFCLSFYLTKKRLVSLIVSFLFLTSPSSWESAFSAGVYMRTFATPFFLFGIYWAILFWEKLEKENFSQKLFSLTCLFLGMSVLLHQHIGMVSFGTLFFLTFFIIRVDFRTKIINFTKICLFSLLLSATFWLPMLVFFPKTPTTSWVTSLASQAVPWQDLVPLSALIPKLANQAIPYMIYGDLARLSTFLFPLALSLLILVYLLRREELSEENFIVRMLKFSGWMTLFWLFYGSGTLLRFSPIFPIITNLYSFMGTHGATWFLPIFVSIAIGLLASFLLKKTPVYLLFFAFIIFLLVIDMFRQYTGLIKFRQMTNQQSNIEAIDFSLFSPSFRKLLSQQQSENFRLASSVNSSTNLLFNHQFPSFAQTGHYFIQGVPNFDIYFYFEDTLRRQPNNKNEIPFLLDWWAIKPILTSAGMGNLKAVGREEGFKLYTYDQSSPILAPTMAQTVLVIGSEKSYQDSFFRSLAIGNIGSHLLIPVTGSPIVEDYNQKSLSDFDIVFLYDYKVNSFTWASSILNNYVKNGGNLIIESNRDVETGRLLPDPFPVKKIKLAERSGDWSFNVEVENSYLEPKDLVNFSPAEYDGGPWGVSEGDGVKDWAKTILTSGGKPILVGGRLGEGKVLWSGLNLAFHIAHNRNEKEAKLLEKIILGFVSFPNNDLPNFKVEFKNPQERILSLEGDARGVLFKENYFPNWHAVAKTSNKKVGLKIYPAGPGFMFTYLPRGVKEVTFVYRRSFFEKIADVISILTFFWLIWLLVRKKPGTGFT
ncbi:MAG: 6-pyruvoyl-tetrahydropterin synthase-related protein [bacterium]|nr:6-pyruvoyl-tetrahydropterin synthase-related protein [bacterium]